MESSSSPFEVQLESKLHMKSDLEAQRAVQEGLESNLEAVLVVLSFLDFRHFRRLCPTHCIDRYIDIDIDVDIDIDIDIDI